MKDFCSSCHLVLHDPHVKCEDSACEERKVRLCLECFSGGRELGEHRSSHAYTIVQNDFTLLDTAWTAKDEITLLESVLSRGHGNWDDIAKELPSKTPTQCEAHFQKIYVEDEDGVFSEVSSDWDNRKEPTRRDQPVALVTPMEHPPRPVHNSQTHKELGGYDVARGDFNHESDNLAEMEIGALDFKTMKPAFDELNEVGVSVAEIAPEDCSSVDQDDRLFSHLQLAAAGVYKDKLRGRARRKRIAAELGLINKTAAASLPNTYHKIVKAGANNERIFKFARLMCSLDFDYFLEGLKTEITLRQSVLHLQEYRNNGLKRLPSTQLYHRLKTSRERRLRDLNTERVSDWLATRQLKAVTTAGGTTTVGAKVVLPLALSAGTRKTAAPLDIISMPGYEKLSEDEKELCSEIRVFPEVFLEIRTTLVAECARIGGLRLADARPVIKIDVNKTRRIFDFLTRKGVIHKPTATTNSTATTKAAQ